MEKLKFFKGKRILITGHSGFKGSWLAWILTQAGAEVIGYSLAPNTEPNLFEILKLEKKVKNYFEDIRNYKKLEEVVIKEKPEIIIHMAAQPLVRESYDFPAETFSTNAMGTLNVLEAIRKTNSVKAAVIVTTDKVYEIKTKGAIFVENDELGGHDPYSSSKVCCEIITKSYIRSYFNPIVKKEFPRVASARAGNVIGGGDWSKDRLIPDIVRAIMEKNETVKIRNPTSVRPWQHVLEPLFGYLILAKRLYEGDNDSIGAWNFAPEEENFVEVQKIVEQAIKILGKGTYKIEKDSGPIKKETEILKLDATKARTHLGWKPNIDIDECLIWTFDFYQQYYNKKDVTKILTKQITEYLERCKYW
jgi:CDP-glucose 4,6-dehydratase